MPKPVAYILSNEHGQPYSANGAVAAQGFEFLGYEVRLFQRQELASLPITAGTPVVGGVGTVQSAVRRMGIEPPAHITAPAVLAPFLGRRCWRTTLSALREAGEFPVFLKPYDDTKRFTGFVAASAADIDKIPHLEGDAKLPPDYAILAQEPVRFLSEWRVFVVRGRAVGCSIHTGDPLLFPRESTIRQAIGAYVHAPDGYSADFGVTDDGRTLLIEINEGYSLGCGHLRASLYAELLLARWAQMSGAG